MNGDARSRSINAAGSKGKKITYRQRVGNFIESKTVDLCVLALVLFYLLIVFTQIILSDQARMQGWIIPEEIETPLNVADITILSLFLIEVSCKTYAFRMKYLNNCMNAFDSIIVVASLVLSLLEMQDSDSEAVGRIGRVRPIMRLLRIVIIFRKVSNATGTVRQISGSAMGYDISSPVERVLEVLGSLKDMGTLSRTMRTDIRFSIDVISSNKLYDPVVSDADLIAHEGETEAQAWLTNASKARKNDESPSTPSQGRRESISGEKKLRGSQIAPEGGSEPIPLPEPTQDSPRSPRPVELLDIDGVIDWNRVIRDLPAGGEAAVSAWLSKYSTQWDCDIWELDAASNHNPLVSISLHIANKLNIFEKNGLIGSSFVNWSRKIQAGYPDSNPFHNSCHAADVTQTIHWVLTEGMLIDRAGFTDKDTFAALMGGMCHDFEHPALNNVFLVKSRHPFAIRYNDKTVLEMHHVAASFAILHNGEDCNFLKQVPRATYDAIRELVINAVLATDMANHFSDLGKLKSKLQTEDFLVPRV